MLQRSLDTSRKASALISRDLDEAKRQIRVLEGKVREGSVGRRRCSEGAQEKSVGEVLLGKTRRMDCVIEGTF